MPRLSSFAVGAGGEAALSSCCNSHLLGCARESSGPGVPLPKVSPLPAHTAGQNNTSSSDHPRRTAAGGLKYSRAPLHKPGAPGPWRGEREHPQGAGGGCGAASLDTYTLQAVLALRHLHTAGADAVAEPLQVLLYLTNFPGEEKMTTKLPVNAWHH